MPRLSELVENESELAVELDGGTLTVFFRPRVLTPEWQKKVEAAERDDDFEGGLYVPLRECLVSWDLETDEGEPYPMDSESLSKLPRKILMSVMVAVVASARPNLPKVLGTSTGGSSEPSNRAMRRRNGTS